MSAVDFDLADWTAKADVARRLAEATPHEEGVIALYAPKEPIPPPKEIPQDEHAERFLRSEARFEGVSYEEMRSRIEEVGYGAYVLEGLRTRRLRYTEAWNALGMTFIEVYRLAYSNGVMEVTDDFHGLLVGKQDGQVARLRKDNDLVVREIAFAPSFDTDTSTPQYAEVGYHPEVKNAPIVILQHGGYPGTRMMEIPKLRELAAKGFFCIAVSKRGRDGSAGRPDGWCRETADIVDGLDHCIREFSDYLDPTNVTVRGMSGGALDTISVLMRFPDRFRIAVAFMGHADVAALYAGAVGPGGDQVIENTPEHSPMIYSMRRLSYEVGRDLPDEADRIMARNYTLGFHNNPYAQIHFVWDETEPAGKQMDAWYEDFRATTERMGSSNVHLHRSKRGDPIRFPHWFGPDIDHVDRFYLADALAGRFPEPQLAPAGELTVLGFLKTRPFEVVLGDGANAVARVEYEIGVDRGFFRFRRLSSAPSARGTLRFANPRGRQLVAAVNGTRVLDVSSAEWIEAPFGIDDAVTIASPSEMGNQ